MALRFKRGDTIVIDCVLRDNATFLTGDVIFFTIKRRLSDADADALVRLDSGTGGVTFTDGGSIATATIPPSAFTGLEKTPVVYDWQLVRAGAITTFDSGSGIIQPDVTIRTT